MIFKPHRQTVQIEARETDKWLNVIPGMLHGVMFKGITPDDLREVRLQIRGITVMEFGESFDVETGDLVSAGRYLEALSGFRGVPQTGGVFGLWFDDGRSPIGPQMTFMKVGIQDAAVLRLCFTPSDKSRELNLFYLQHWTS
jgi:hypothetical protein